MYYVVTGYVMKCTKYKPYNHPSFFLNIVWRDFSLSLSLQIVKSIKGTHKKKPTGTHALQGLPVPQDANTNV